MTDKREAWINAKNTTEIEKTAKKEQKVRLPVLIARIFACCAALGVFGLYLIKNCSAFNKAGAYPLTDFIAPFITLFAFMTIVYIAMPKLLGALAGYEDEPYMGLKKKELTRKFVRIVLGALALHIVFGIIGALMFKTINHTSGQSFLKLWQNAWMKGNTDAGHYLKIAANWYQKDGDDKLLLVFLPMFPWFVSKLDFMLDNAFVSAQIINAVATALTAGMTYLTFRPVMGEHRSTVGAFAFIMLPGAIFMNSPMSEPLFMLFTVCAFYFMERRMFIVSGVFVALAGFTRSLGVVAAVPLAIVGIGRIVRHYKSGMPVARDILHILIALIISTFGTLGYLYINYRLHGNCLKFLEFQQHWYQKASPFFDTPRYMFSYLFKEIKAHSEKVYALWGSGLIAIAASLIIVGIKAKRLPAHYTAYFLFYFAAAVGCTWLLSSVRYLSAAMPVSAALALGCRKNWQKALLFTVLAVLYLAYMYMYMARWDVY